MRIPSFIKTEPRWRSPSIGFVVTALCLAATTPNSRGAAAPVSKPTFTEQVAPILFLNCVPCHRPGEAAPFSLMTYEQVRKHARQISEVTGTKFMPPWHAEAGHVAFLNPRVLQDDQIATLRRCREHLAPGGCLRLMVFHPSAEKLLQWSGAESLVKELSLPGGGRLRVHDRALDDRVEQVRRMTRRLEFTDDGGRVSREETLTFDLRYVFKPEMELLLRVAGFRTWKVEPLFASYADASAYPAGQGIREGDHLLWSAWGVNA
jgi:hypothetical protein